MEEQKGKLIVIEGGDGTGKTDQVKLLVERLKQEGRKVIEADFPRYGKPPDGHPASFFERKYLIKHEFGFTKGYGEASQVNPYAASLCYAIDRFDAAHDQENGPNLWDCLSSGHVVVSNRYTQSNIGYQAIKIDDPTERREFIRWLMDMEYGKLGIPQPGLVILLDLETVLAMELKARQRKNQDVVLDAHERDRQILEKARWAYLEAARLFPEAWTIISVGSRVHPSNPDPLAGIYSREIVHEKIWDKVKEFLSRG